MLRSMNTPSNFAHDTAPLATVIQFPDNETSVYSAAFLEANAEAIKASMSRHPARNRNPLPLIAVTDPSDLAVRAVLHLVQDR